MAIIILANHRAAQGKCIFFFRIMICWSCVSTTAPPIQYCLVFLKRPKVNFSSKQHFYMLINLLCVFFIFTPPLIFSTCTCVSLHLLMEQIDLRLCRHYRWGCPRRRRLLSAPLLSRFSVWRSQRQTWWRWNPRRSATAKQRNRMEK